MVVLLGLSGQARYLMDGAVHELGPGSLLWAFSGQAHVLLSDTPDFDMWVFLISDRILGPDESASLPPLRLTEGAGAAPKRLSGQATKALEEIAEAVRGEPCPAARRTGLRWWLMRAWAFWKAADTLDVERVHPAVERAARLLRASPEMLLSEVAREAGLSQTRLSRIFHEETGSRLVDFRTDQKLERVDSIMRTRRSNLTAAALEAGFGSYAQFFRALRERRGVSPRDYYRLK